MRIQAISIARRLLAPQIFDDSRLYNLLVRSVTNQAIFLASLGGEILSWNAGVQQILGYTEREFLGRNVALLFDDEEQRTCVPEYLIASAIREGTTSEARWHLRSDGRHIYSTRVFTVVRDETGRASALAILLHDATLQKETEERRQQITEALQRSNQDLSRVGDILSHDLRAPLHMIGTYIGILSRDLDGRLDESSRECMNYVLQGVDHMDQLITSLDSYAQAGHIKLSAAAVDLERILHKTIAILKLVLTENAAVITHDPLPTIQGDSTLLIELFQNIIANALKYRTADPPRIHISARETSEEWTLSVRDNGIGIDPRYAEQIFLPMTRLHGPQISGSGIGLAVCKRIAERHSGRLWVESAVGSGSIFYFSLPKIYRSRDSHKSRQSRPKNRVIA